MGFMMPKPLMKVAAAEVKQVEDEKKELDKRQDAALDAISELSKYFDKMKKMNLTPSAVSSSKQAMTFISGIKPYLDAVGVVLSGESNEEKIASLNKYLEVKVDGKAPGYLLPATLENLNAKMLELTSGKQAELNANYVGVTMPAPAPAFAPPELGVTAKAWLDRIGKAVEKCDKYSLAPENTVALIDYKKKLDNGTELSKQEQKKLNDLLTAIDLKAKAEEKKIAEAPVPVEAAAPEKMVGAKASKELLKTLNKYIKICDENSLGAYSTKLGAYQQMFEINMLLEKDVDVLKNMFAEIDKGVQEKKAGEKTVAAVETSKITLVRNYIDTFSIVGSEKYSAVFGKLTKTAAKKEKDLSKILKKLEGGAALTEKEEKAITDSRMYLLDKVIPALKKYEPMLVSVPLDIYANLQASDPETAKHVNVPYEQYAAAMAELDKVVKEGGDVSQPANAAVKAVAGEHWFMKWTSFFVKSTATKLLKNKAISKNKQNNDIKKELTAIQKEAASLYKNIGKEVKVGKEKKMYTYAEVGALWDKFGKTSSKAAMLINEAETEAKLKTKPLSAVGMESIATAVSLRTAQIELESKKLTPQEAKEALGGAIEKAKGVLSEDDKHYKLLINAAENILNNEKDSAYMQEAAHALLAIAEAKFLYQNNTAFANTESNLEEAKMSIDLAVKTYGWLFAGEKPAIGDITIARRVAYHANHVLSPMLNEYEKYLYAEGKQKNPNAWTTAFTVAAVLKEKKGTEIDITRAYSADIPLYCDPAFGRIPVSGMLEIGTEENPDMSPYGMLLGQLELVKPRLSKLMYTGEEAAYQGKNMYEVVYDKMLKLSMLYGFPAVPLDIKRQEVKKILNEILSTNEMMLREELEDKIKALEKAAGLEVTALEMPLDKYEDLLFMERKNLEKNQEFVKKMKKGDIAKYGGKEISKTEAENLLKKWEAELNKADKYLQAAKKQGLEVATLPKAEGVNIDIAEWISKNLSTYREKLTYSQLIALTEVGFDVIEGKEVKAKGPGPVPVEIPEIGFFKKFEKGVMVVSPALIAIKSTVPDYTVTKVYTDTWAGVGVVTDIAGNAPFLYGGTEQAQLVLDALTDAAAAAYSKTSTSGDVKLAAKALLDILPENINTPDSDTQAKYHEYRQRVQEAAENGNKETLKGAVEGLSADPSVGGGLANAMHFFRFDAKRNSFFYAPMGAFAEFWFGVDKEALKAIEDNEQVATKIIGTFIKLTGTYMSYPGEYVEVDKDGKLVPGGEKYKGKVEEAGAEIAAGTMLAAAKGKVIITFRTQISIKQQKVSSLQPLPGEMAKEKAQGTYLSLDVIDATLSLPNGKVFKGAGLGLIKPVAGQVSAGEVATPTYGLNPILHATFGWDKKSGKVTGGVYVQPGIIFFGQGLEGFKKENIIYFGALQGNLLLNFGAKGALGLKTGTTVTSQAIKGEIGVDTRIGIDYYFKMGENASGAISTEGYYDWLTGEYGVFGGVKFFIPEKKK
ncbi:hypothetical protein H0O02_01720 [Candidatus Micrarchaeota archaeon]|nr:hypothetical protein [Candidatus Micrarchaeota archaeon]